MVTVNPYLNFNGNCEEAFLFYKSVFGGEFPYVGRYSEMPSEQALPESEANKIMHMSLPISKETTLMGSDSNEAFGPPATFGDNITISVNTDSEEEALRIFNGLSEGGIVKMPMEKTFWGSYFGMFVDKFGINWMVNYDYEKEQ